MVVLIVVCELVREAVFRIGVGFWLWCFFRLNLGELGLIVGVWGLFGCVVDGEWFVIDAFMSVSGGWIWLTLHFVVGLVSLWNDDGSRMLNWSLWWVKLSIVITVILINSPGVILVSRRWEGDLRLVLINSPGIEYFWLWSLNRLRFGLKVGWLMETLGRLGSWGDCDVFLLIKVFVVDWCLRLG